MPAPAREERVRPGWLQPRDRWPLAYGGALLLVLLNVVANHQVRSYNSDDTALQTILGQWARGYHRVAHLGPDTFVPKLPLYGLLRVTMGNGRPALLVTAAILNLAGFALFAVSVHYFARRFAPERPASFVGPLIWLASFGVPLTSLLMNPNVRNVEIGVAFFFLMLVARYRDGELPFSPPWLLAAVPLLGLFLYDDPYFLFMFVVPLTALLAATLVLGPGKRRSLHVILLLAGGVVAYKVIERGAAHFGLEAAEAGTSFSRPEQIGQHVRLLLRGSLLMFDADLFANSTLGLRALHSLLNLVLLVAVLVFPVVLLGLRARFRDDPWKWFFALYPFFVAAVFVFSTQAVDIFSARYLVLIPFLAVLILGITGAAVRPLAVRRAVVVVLAAAALANLASTFRTYRREQGTANAYNFEVIRAATGNGMTKGYAGYWSANINTYLAQDRVDFIAVSCVGSRSQLYLWLMDDGILVKRASRSFFLWEGDDPTGCSYDDLTRQFGPPGRVIAVGDQRKLLLYDYDLGQRIPRP